MNSDDGRPCQTHPEYLAGVAWGTFSRDGEVSLLIATIHELQAEIVKLRATIEEQHRRLNQRIRPVTEPAGAG
jgi:hypothetical protein